ncbi:MAG TPA: YetF domain-containing protein [Thermoanaerobaculia bacterium]|nr:YetF domain-containing protein [Thermoanaerobaculia bacterium]
MEVDWQQLGETAARGLFVYALMLLVIRLLGKRTVGNFTAFDLLVALMLGEVVDEIIYGDVTLAQGTVAILVVAAAKYATAWLTFFGHGFEKVLEGTPTEIVRNGELLQKGLRREVLTEREALAALRLHGVDDLREVKKAVMEVDGEVSVILEEWAEPLQKGDVLKKQSKQRKQRVAGEEDDEEMRTDTPRALGTE